MDTTDKKLGLDLGSSSIGWALREENEITQKGVVTFQSGMIKGQGGGYSSPTKDRREARSKRRLIQARKYRKWELLEALLNEFIPLNQDELEAWSKYIKGKPRKFPENEYLLKWLACDFTYLENGIRYKNPYELRVKALTEKLSKHEFGRALYHLVQRRGYKDIGESNAETEKQKKRRDESGFRTAIDNHGTIAKALFTDFLNKGERARNQYPLREEYEHELLEILKAQGYNVQMENEEPVDLFVRRVYKSIIWQRPLRSQKGNIGKCTIEPTKPRCPVSHPIYEICRAWQFINTIKYRDQDEEEKIPLPIKEKLFKELFIKKDRNFKFEEIRKFLDKQFNAPKTYNYPYDSQKNIYDSSVSGMPICCNLYKAFGNIFLDGLFNLENFHMGNAPKIIGGYSIYDLWHAVFSFEESFLKKIAEEKLNLNRDSNKKEYDSFIKIKSNIVQGYSDLSFYVMRKIIPFLKEGFLYNEAVLLAKIPDQLGDSWEKNKEAIKSIITKSNAKYEYYKNIIEITNSLIDKYKGLDYSEIYAYKNFQYKLESTHDKEINEACLKYFGQKSWDKKSNKNSIQDDVKQEFQEFFWDMKRAYRTVPTLNKIFIDQLKSNNIEINDNLYHHSNRKNIYGNKIIDKMSNKEILPSPRVDSIKNPMFNKSMTILRNLINELIKNDIIDERTEVIVEVARELNDNNKRVAIERYQNERRAKREKYRDFLNEFKERVNGSINVEESLSTFELWTEQTFDSAEDEHKVAIKNVPTTEILREKEALKRYELWMEQKGQCMYTGRMISITQLFSNEIDIEHTIPRSLLPDDTMANQTVCFANYNRSIKKNQMPYYCPNYSDDKEGIGTQILARLNYWEDTRDSYKELYEKRIKPYGNEDEAKKNQRIQEKHYYKMHFDYWNNKIERFLAEEIKDSWVRRQLVDTQMVSKYAREFLKTYFKKVIVQKGSVTASFRKIYSFQEEDEIKSRNMHTHHAIDAAVLTLIPTNSSLREQLLKEMYKVAEIEKKQFTTIPFTGFNSQKIIHNIDSTTLIVNYGKDKILNQTFKNIRKRGKLQSILADQEKIILKSKGDTVRSNLYKQTFLGKIHNVVRDKNGKPQRSEDGKWLFIKGNEEFIFTERKPLSDVLSKIEDIVDPVIREIVRKQKDKAIDFNGKKIRHVRIKVKNGQVVKERANYKSKYDYKNYYYSAAGSIPYAVFLQKNDNSSIQRDMIPVASFEVAKNFKEFGKFDIVGHLNAYHPEYTDYEDKKLLKVGQKVIILNSDEDYEKRHDLDFLRKRLYVINQFSEGSIWLKYHLEARADNDIDDSVKEEKDRILHSYEIEYEIPEIFEDLTISDNKERKEDYKKRRYSFDNLSRFRFQRLIPIIGIDKTKAIKKELDSLKKQASTITEESEGKTPLLKMSKENWNFLLEGYDFKISLLGQLEWIGE